MRSKLARGRSGRRRQARKGPIEEHAESPEGSPTKAESQFSKKFDRVTGDDVTDDNFYELEVPSHVRATASNAEQLLPSVPPLEAFVEEHYNDPTLKQTLDQALENRELPPNYLSHPFVVNAPPGTIVLPGGVLRRRDAFREARWPHRVLDLLYVNRGPNPRRCTPKE